MQPAIFEIISRVQKPGRYIAEEINSIKKDFYNALIKVAICFPDYYEVGMSNLGLRILYGILNSLDGVVCERVFAVDRDVERLLRESNVALFSLESMKGLHEFDLVGFSLAHELQYTNVLAMLSLGRVPLRASQRSLKDPLVVGGGPCVINPEPVADFFDFFVIGEAEDVVVELMDVYRKYKQKKQVDKRGLLRELSLIEGIYVPSFYNVTYNISGNVVRRDPHESGMPQRIKRRYVRNFETSFFPDSWIIPYIQIIHDRVTIEIMRGCPNRCRFCQARVQYSPFRQRSPERVYKLALDAYRKTGYADISLVGLSVSDYAQIQNLVGSLVEYFRKFGVGISLPSLKAKTLIGDLSSFISSIKKTGLTFAPEAATPRLRQILGKDFDEREFFDVLRHVYRVGYQRLKLYFMIGIPEETEDDLTAITEFAQRVSYLRKELCGSSALVNISINTLIPKPHTPFQWLGMQGRESISKKQRFLRSKIKSKKIQIHFHDMLSSTIEAILSRGDRRLGEIIEYVFLQGARFESWEDNFRFEVWQEAFRVSGIAPDNYLLAKKLEDVLPWDIIDSGISREALWGEYCRMHDKSE